MSYRLLSWLARILLGGGLVFSGTGLLVSRVRHEGERELALSRALIPNGDIEGAVVHARRSAMWYLPNATHVTQARETLQAAAVAAEGRGDPGTALFAWRALRASAWATRNPFSDTESTLAVADASIVRLSALPSRTGDHEESRRRMQDRLARSSSIPTHWVLGYLLGCAVMFAAFVHGSSQGVDDQATPRWKRLRISIIALAGGALLWGVSLWSM